MLKFVLLPNLPMLCKEICSPGVPASFLFSSQSSLPSLNLSKDVQCCECCRYFEVQTSETIANVIQISKFNACPRLPHNVDNFILLILKMWDDPTPQNIPAGTMFQLFFKIGIQKYEIYTIVNFKPRPNKL